MTARCPPSTTLPLQSIHHLSLLLSPISWGRPQATAEAAILAGKLTVGTVTSQASLTVPADIVISQNPVAGSTVLEGTAVALVISSGPPLQGVNTAEDAADVNPGDGIC